MYTNYSHLIRETNKFHYYCLCKRGNQPAKHTMQSIVACSTVCSCPCHCHPAVCSQASLLGRSKPPPGALGSPVRQALLLVVIVSTLWLPCSPNDSLYIHHSHYSCYEYDKLKLNHYVSSFMPPHLNPVTTSYPNNYSKITYLFDCRKRDLIKLILVTIRSNNYCQSIHPCVLLYST